MDCLGWTVFDLAMAQRDAAASAGRGFGRWAALMDLLSMVLLSMDLLSMDLCHNLSQSSESSFGLQVDCSAKSWLLCLLGR